MTTTARDSAPDATPLLTASSLEVGYASRALLPPVSFTLHREQWWALVGRNGGGKTTMLRTLLGLLPRVRGTFAWAPHARIGYVPQRSELDLSVPQRVLDVVAQGLDAGMSFVRPFAARRERARVDAALQEVGMAHLARTAFAALSDGQRQRVLVARALVHEPDVLILDEPTNGMDIASERAAFELFARLQTARRLALVVVTHHMSMLGSRATHALWVDKDEQRALSGPLVDVSADPAFAAHYGSVFAHPATTTTSDAKTTSTGARGAA